jgi:hypothetical protein
MALARDMAVAGAMLLLAALCYLSALSDVGGLAG